MRKYIIPLVFISLAACKNEPDDRLQVKGSLLNNPGKQSVYFDEVELDDIAPRTLDTAILQPGTAMFRLSGIPDDYEEIYRLRFEKNGFFVLLVNDRKDISFSGDWNDFGSYTTNSPSSNSFQGMLREFNNKLMHIDSLRKGIIDAKVNKAADGISTSLDSNFRVYVTATEDYLLKYADTTQSPSIALYIVGPLLKSQLEPSRFEPVITSMSKRFGSHPIVQKVVKQYFDNMQKQKSNHVAGIAAPEISLPDPDGKIIRLSSFRGKYVLVDFWASWCGPCRMENPNVVYAYNQYKNKNFTVLGVSLDKSKEPWIKAIKDDNLTWTHISDLKFWESSVVPLYQIEGIPFNVLVDPGGNIIASNLRGQALERKLAEVLK